jgi:hypothetical protein
MGPRTRRRQWSYVRAWTGRPRVRHEGKQGRTTAHAASTDACTRVRVRGCPRRPVRPRARARRARRCRKLQWRVASGTDALERSSIARVRIAVDDDHLLRAVRGRIGVRSVERRGDHRGRRPVSDARLWDRLREWRHVPIHEEIAGRTLVVPVHDIKRVRDRSTVRDADRGVAVAGRDQTADVDGAQAHAAPDGPAPIRHQAEAEASEGDAAPGHGARRDGKSVPAAGRPGAGGNATLLLESGAGRQRLLGRRPRRTRRVDEGAQPSRPCRVLRTRRPGRWARSGRPRSGRHVVVDHGVRRPGVRARTPARSPPPGSGPHAAIVDRPGGAGGGRGRAGPDVDARAGPFGGDVRWIRAILGSGRVRRRGRTRQSHVHGPGAAPLPGATPPGRRTTDHRLSPHPGRRPARRDRFLGDLSPRSR